MSDDPKGPHGMTPEQRKLYQEIIGEAKELDLAFRNLLGSAGAPANPAAAMALVGIAANIWQQHKMGISFLVEFMTDYYDWMVLSETQLNDDPRKKGN